MVIVTQYVLSNVPSTNQRVLIVQGSQGTLLAASIVLTVFVVGGLEYLCIERLDTIEANEYKLEKAAIAAWSTPDSGFEDPVRAEAARDAMRHAWHGYENYAWGADELQPETKTGKFGVLGGLGGFSGLGASIVDAMSTLHVMGLDEEFERAHAWIAENMTFDREAPQTISFFETTIRCLGGLLAAHDLTGSKLFLEKAEDLGRRIAPVFQGSPTGILTNNAGLPQTRIYTGDDNVALAELGSNLIEFGTLGRRTGNATYRLLAEDSMRFIHAKYPTQPLLGTTIQRQTGRISDEQVTIAAPVDSYFEYLVKYWILGGKTDDHWRDRWINATDMALDVLQVRTQQGGFAFTGDIPYKGAAPTTDVTHLGCFYPGNVALGVISGAATGERAVRYLEFAEKMMYTCFQLYNITKTGLGADNAIMDVASGKMTITGTNYLQRPEVVESLFYLWRATHNERYRDWGWSILQAIEKHCRKEAGYSGVNNVDALPTESDNVQQSWFLAETLKYLFLLFSDDTVVPLDQWVFNTEAHPVRVNFAEEPNFIDWDWN